MELNIADDTFVKAMMHDGTKVRALNIQSELNARGWFITVDYEPDRLFIESVDGEPFQILKKNDYLVRYIKKEAYKYENKMGLKVVSTPEFQKNFVNVRGIFYLYQPKT